MIANGNFYEAAEQFHVSQSAVSQQIKKLDVNLLDRHNRTFRSLCRLSSEDMFKIVTGQDYMPVDVIGEQVWFDTTVFRIPLVRNREPVFF